jgi:hypothetical protein
MLMEQMSSACDTLLVAKELFDRGDCDDALLGVIAYIGKIGKEMSTTVMKGWSTEQVHENSAELDRMTDRAKRGESFSGMAKVGVEIMAPMIHKSRQRQLTAALTAQLCERGCGDPECESCSGPSPADQPGDLVIPDDFESNGSDQ